MILSLKVTLAIRNKQKTPEISKRSSAVCIREHLASCHLCEPDWLIITTGYTSCSHQIVTSSRRLGVRNCCTPVSRALLHMKHMKTSFKPKRPSLKKKKERKLKKTHFLWPIIINLVLDTALVRRHCVSGHSRWNCGGEITRDIHILLQINYPTGARWTKSDISSHTAGCYFFVQAVTYQSKTVTLALNASQYKSSVQHKLFAFWSLGKIRCSFRVMLRTESLSN